jgi:hypothetical protein
MADGRDRDDLDFPEFPPLDETGTVDLWQLEVNRSMTPTQRMRQYEVFAEMYEAFKKAGAKHYGFDPSVDPTSERGRG